MLDSVRGGVTVPYSPEFADLESNSGLLEKLREITGGISIADDASAMARAAASGEVFRAGLASSRSMQPIWFWLVLATAVVLFFDIAVRRIAIEPEAVAAAASRVWDRLRGRVVPVVTAPQFLDRLRSRKELVSDQLDKGRSTMASTAATSRRPMPVRSRPRACRRGRPGRRPHRPPACALKRNRKPRISPAA